MLHASALTYRRPPTFVLTTEAFSAPAGRILGVLGPNGSGKSTLLQLLAGTLKAEAGSVSWDGRPRQSVGLRRWSRHVAFVPQHFGQAPPMLVRDYVAMGLIPHRGLFSGLGNDAGDLVDQAMQTCGVEGLATMRVCDLSGGQHQRVRIAKALAQSADVVILDEPTNHLDVAAVSELVGLLRRLARDGMSVLVSLHDIDLAAFLADEVMILKDGATYAFGATKTTLTPGVIRECWKVDMVPVHAASHRRYLVDYPQQPRPRPSRPVTVPAPDVMVSWELHVRLARHWEDNSTVV